MSVSVIIPLFNKRYVVSRAIRSVFAQTVPPLEIIVVDDGSTDDSAREIKLISNGNVRLIQQSNRGPGAARNRGLAEARGDFVAFLDADDAWSPTYLEHALAVFAESGPEIAAVTCGYNSFPSGRPTTSLWRGRGIGDGVHRLRPTSEPLWCVHLLAFMSPCTTVARTEVVRRLGGFYHRDRCLYGEDAYLWLKVLLNEAVATKLVPLVDIHGEDSSLNVGSRRQRPVEPLLTAPDELFSSCPRHLHRLLGEILAERATKTAAVLGYWGQWREGRKLLRIFLPGKSPRLARRVTAELCASPLGTGLGMIHRAWQQRSARGEVIS